MREKEMLKTLVNKPFIIRLQLTFMDKEHLYFVFDHCMFGTLSKLITATGGLGPEVVRHYAAEIVEALSQCYESKIMHRDLKPENILISEDRHLKLIDFGDAKLFEEEDFTFKLKLGGEDKGEEDDKKEDWEQDIDDDIDNGEEGLGFDMLDDLK